MKFVLKHFLNLSGVSLETGEVEKKADGSTILRVFSLGFYGRGSNVQQKATDSHRFEPVAREILGDLKNILKTLMCCWAISSEFNEYCQMTNYGVITFDYDKFNKYNKNVKMLIEETQKMKSIKGLITKMLIGLMSRYRDAVLESFIELWISESRIKNYPPEPNNALNRRKIIEMMV